MNRRTNQPLIRARLPVAWADSRWRPVIIPVLSGTRRAGGEFPPLPARVLPTADVAISEDLSADILSFDI